MAEVKNAFIKSKMNQDLDARLLPSGEYREGFNIQVSKSEGPDVGALENVLGNQIIQSTQDNLEVLTGLSTVSIIGAYIDKSSDTLFLFITNNTQDESYNPNGKNFIYSFNVTNGLFTKLVEGAFLNFHTNYPVIGVNLLENLLFFTDNRNQPRKININEANTNIGSNIATYYTTEDQISVAKYSPYQAINLYKYQTDPVPYGGQAEFVTTMQDAVSEKLPDGTTDNPYYDATYPGDQDFLEDKFVRFGYRFKFVDGEYSVFSTFTQEAFIPQQDGYFLGNDQYITPGDDSNITDDEANTYRSGEVSFMINKANKINLVIPIESENFIEDQNIVEIDILYKESDGLAVQVVDTLDKSYIENNITEYTGLYFIEYEYQGRKPYKTLPESQLLRVYDKVPVKAFGQEVSGNRIIYSNFQDKHTPPVNLNYNITVSPKFNFKVSTPGVSINPTGYNTSIVEYPEHTVKQDRNYQVGVVLSDKFGRSSTVLLSALDSTSPTGLDEGVFYGSTVFHEYINKAQYQGDYKPNAWAGDSIKLIFNDSIQKESDRAGYPGVYNGDPTKTEYNPLGWYSYKIVVKQTEQEYYNVYLPGILEGDPNAPTTAGNPTGTIATIPLIGDNVNKVPKELTNVNPTQKQFSSNTVLFPRVTANFVDQTNPTFNEAFFPTSKGVNVAALGDYRDLLRDTNGDPIDPLSDIYESTTNPLIARLATANSGVAYSSDILGSFPTKNPQPYPYYLSVLETNPVVSRIEIYYETSTSGLVSDLNTATLEGALTPVELKDWNFTLNENDAIGNQVSDPFYVTQVDPLQGLIPATNSTLNSFIVIDNNGVDRTVDFQVVKVPGGGALSYDTYYITTTTTFVYTSESSTGDGNFEFSFNFSITGQSTSETFLRNGLLQNSNPTILATDGTANLPTSIQINPGDIDIYQFTGKNGTVSQDPGDRNIDLFWSITSGNETENFEITTNGLLKAIGDNITGNFNLTIRLQDGGGALDEYLLQVTSDVIPNLTFINDSFWCTPTAPITLSAGNGSSSGFYWTSSADNAQSNEPYVRDINTSLQLPSTLGGYDTRSQTAQQSGCNMFTFSNTNFTSKGNYTDNLVVNQSPQTDTNLQSGTAFVQVTANARQPYYSDASGSGIGQGCINGFDGLLKVTFPIVLQYRDPNSSSYPNNWITAIDTEGVDCTFGGEQQTSSNPRLAYNNNFGFSKSGVLVERNISSLSTPGGNPDDTSQVNIQMFKEGLDGWQQPYEQISGGDAIENGEQQVSGWTVEATTQGEIINPSTFRLKTLDLYGQKALKFFDLFLTRNNSNSSTPFTVKVKINGEDIETQYVTTNNFNNSYRVQLNNYRSEQGKNFTVFIEADSNISFDSIAYEMSDFGSGQANTSSEFSTAFEYVATSSTDAVYTTVLASESKLTKTFAFGRDQYYNERPDRFGDYRLIVRYPFGDYPAPVSSTCGGNGLATVTPTGCPDNDVFKSTNNIDFSDVKMQYGDFYNPVAAGKPCLPTEYSDIINPSSYEYKISTIPINDIDQNTSIELASRILPTRTVYAREWHCKYITKLYTDAALQNEVTNLVSGWYSYSLATDVSRVETSGMQSYDFVLSQNDRSHSQEQGATIASIDSNEERRWVAYFTNGVKQAASAVSNIFGTSGFSDIGDDDGDADCVGINIYPQSYFDEENQFESNSKTLAYTTCGGVSSTISFSPSGIIGQNTQEYFTVCVDRTQLITIDNQPIDPGIDSDSDCSSSGGFGDTLQEDLGN